MSESLSTFFTFSFWFKFSPLIVSWWGILLLFSMVCLPLTLATFHRLPDRGYGFSKILGLALVTFINWLFCHRIFRFSPFSIAISMSLLGMLSFYAFTSKWHLVKSFLVKRWRYILLIECLFLLALIFFIAIRSYTPEITYKVRDSAAEKFGDFMMFNSISRSDYFPPEDAWLSGYPLNYYYFGHLMWATVGKIARYEPAVAYNCAIASLFALLFIQVFSLGYNLTRKISYGVLGACAAAMFGNIEAFIQFKEKIVHVGFREGIQWLLFDFWSTSRIVHDAVTEFPYFSYLLGDLHAHVSSLLLFTLGIALLLQIERKKREPYWLNFSTCKNMAREIVLLAFIFGALYMTNGWDIVTYGILVLIVMIPFSKMKSATRLTTFIEGGVLTALAAAFGCFILFGGFMQNYISPIEARLLLLSDLGPFGNIYVPIGIVRNVTRTVFVEYWIYFGQFLLPVLVCWLLFFAKYTSRLKGKQIFVLLSFILFIFMMSYSYYKHMAAPLGGTLCAIILWGLITAKRDSDLIFAAKCLIAAFFITIVCETIFIDDRFEGKLERYNTIFKFYYPVWVLFALGATYALYTIRNVSFLSKWIRMPLAYMLALFMIFFGVWYPILGTIERTHIFGTVREWRKTADPGRTLDGIAYLKYDSFSKDDYYAIEEFFNTKVRGKPVVLERTGEPSSYAYTGRISANTGLPTLVGWMHHQSQWRGNRARKVLARRVVDAEAIYQSLSTDGARELLEKYSIQYIVVGNFERQKYSTESLSKFDTFCTRVYERDSTVVYEYLQEHEE